MSKIRKNYGWLNTRPNSSKTLLERAKREVPGFADHIRKFEEQITIKSYSPSTVFSYSRCIAQISLYCKKSPLDLDLDEINSYLYTMKMDRDMSETFFKPACGRQAHRLQSAFFLSDLRSGRSGHSPAKHEEQAQTSCRVFTGRVTAAV